MKNTLIIEIHNSGLGDHLFHSHLPRIAKENGGYEKVYISNKSVFKTQEYVNLVWGYNPFIDGFTDEHGTVCKIEDVVGNLHPESKHNLLDEVMLSFGLENNKRWNTPEIYYKPKFIKKYNKSIFDPNFLSWIGNVTSEDAMTLFKKESINFEYIMKQRSEKFFFKPSKDTEFIETPSLEDFCDLIFSSEKFYCLTSGAATLASAMNKNASVFYGGQQLNGFRHHKGHNYIYVPRYFLNRVKRKLRLI